jgi:hypothetical protein
MKDSPKRARKRFLSQASEARSKERRMQVERLEARWTLSATTGALAEPPVIDFAIANVDLPQEVAMPRDLQGNGISLTVPVVVDREGFLVLRAERPEPSQAAPPFEASPALNLIGELPAPDMREVHEFPLAPVVLSDHPSASESDPRHLEVAAGPFEFQAWNVVPEPKEVLDPSHQPGKSPAGGDRDASHDLPFVEFHNDARFATVRLISRGGGEPWQIGFAPLPDARANPAAFTLFSSNTLVMAGTGSGNALAPLPSKAVPQGDLASTAHARTSTGASSNSSTTGAAPSPSLFGEPSETASNSSQRSGDESASSESSHLEVSAVPQAIPHRQQLAVVPEVDLSKGLEHEPAVSSDMGRIDRGDYPVPPVAPAAVSDAVAFLDIAAPDAALQEPTASGTAEARFVVDREEIVLDGVMAQAYAFALDAADESQPVADRAEPAATPQQAVSDTPPSPTGDQNAMRSKPPQAGVDAAMVLLVAAPRLLSNRSGKKPSRQ